MLHKESIDKNRSICASRWRFDHWWIFFRTFSDLQRGGGGHSSVPPPIYTSAERPNNLTITEYGSHSMTLLKSKTRALSTEIFWWATNWGPMIQNDFGIYNGIGTFCLSGKPWLEMIPQDYYKFITFWTKVWIDSWQEMACKCLLRLGRFIYW